MNTDYFKNVRTTCWFVVLFSPVIYVGIIILNFAYLTVPARNLAELSSGLIYPTFLISLPLLVIVIGLFIIFIGKIRFQDLGIQKGKISEAVAVTLGVWILLQLILMLTSVVYGKGISLDDSWYDPGVRVVIGMFAAQLLGNALSEEIMFRGFLFPQLYLKIKFSKQSGKKKRLIISILVSQLCFALMHIPNLTRIKIPGISLYLNLVTLLVLGVFFTVIFLRTNNIFVAVGLHTLLNTPTPLLWSPITAGAVVFVLYIGVIIWWPKIQEVITGVFRIWYNDIPG